MHYAVTLVKEHRLEIVSRRLASRIRKLFHYCLCRRVGGYKVIKFRSTQSRRNKIGGFWEPTGSRKFLLPRFLLGLCGQMTGYPDVLYAFPLKKGPSKETFDCNRTANYRECEVSRSPSPSCCGGASDRRSDLSSGAPIHGRPNRIADTLPQENHRPHKLRL